MLDITLIPHEVKVLSKKALDITSAIKKDLNTPIVEALAGMFDGGGQLLADATTACDKAIAALTALSGLSDQVQNNAILQRLGSDLVKIAHNSQKHSISFYITSFEIIFHDIFGGGNVADAATA